MCYAHVHMLNVHALCVYFIQLMCVLCTYFYFKVDGGHIWVWCRHPGVKVHLLVHLSHHLRLEDVTTPPVKPEHALIQMHVYIYWRNINA